MMARASIIPPAAQGQAANTPALSPAPGRPDIGPRLHPLTPYQALVRELSDRLLDVVGPIRILGTLRWGDEIEKAFFAAGARKLPPVSAAYYQRRPLPFDPDRKRTELGDLARAVGHRLGKNNPAGHLLTRRCHEYRTAVELLVHRGTATFASLSAKLYGSSADRPSANGPTFAELARRMAGALHPLCPQDDCGPDGPICSGAEAEQVLAGRLASFFGDEAVRVRAADGMLADAAAGHDYIKLRRDARFTPRDVRLLEVHEGWIHLGTTRNGRSQPVCTFLAKGSPAATLTQEGLAVLTEVLTLACHPGRVRRLVQRSEAVARAEAGADFLDVYRYFLSEGYVPRVSYYQAVRVFRGSLAAGGPFTKDLCYCKGLLQLCGFLRGATRAGMAGRIPLLFCGKTSLAEIEALGQLADEGLLAAPRLIPPPFTDLTTLVAWQRCLQALGGLTCDPAPADQAASG
jgi:uncharacterized protein (TIGR02421 family)